jgi:D-sedoheptulose 7-phosphate isomerase
MKDNICKYLNTLKNTIDLLDIEEISTFIKVLTQLYDKGGNIYLIGNGGSASTASHFACDLNKGVSFTLNKKFKVISLADNIPTMLAYANDVDFSDIFVEQLKNHLTEKDMVIGISGSGNSKNIVKAIEYANSLGSITVGITGYDGGELKKTADHVINANIDNMQISEDIHMILTHLTTTVLSEELKAREMIAIGLSQ